MVASKVSSEAIARIRILSQIDIKCIEGTPYSDNDERSVVIMMIGMIAGFRFFSPSVAISSCSIKMTPSLSKLHILFYKISFNFLSK